MPVRSSGGSWSPCLRGHLARFKDLLVTDATVVRLHDALARAFPGCRTNHTRAGAKLHLIMSVLGAGPRSVAVTGERVNERRRLGIGRWVAGRLLLFDLGSCRWQLFERIRANGGYFISRLRDDVNLSIVAEIRRGRGASRKVALASVPASPEQQHHALLSQKPRIRTSAARR